MKITAAVTESNRHPDVNTILSGGRVVRGIVEGDGVPDVFLPRVTLRRHRLS